MIGATLLGWILLALIQIIAAEAGYRLHNWARARRKENPDDEDEGSGYVLSAALGLLGLLIAFVFSMAAAHHETRRDLVLREADAISSAVQHYQLLPEPHRTVLISTMADYVKVRRAFFDVGDDFDKIDETMARTEALQEVIWNEAGVALAIPQAQRLTVPVLNVTSQMFDSAALRYEALNVKVPDRALQVLILYAVVTAAIMGHGLAPGGRRHFTSTAGLFLLIALAISLVIDLDSPRVGSVHVSQAPMERVINQVLVTAAKLPPATRTSNP